MYLSAQVEHMGGDCVPVLKGAQAAMSSDSSKENPFPNATVNVARVINNGGEIDYDWYVRQGAPGADRWWSDHGGWVDDRPWITHLICLNEPSVKTTIEARTTASFLLRWLKLLDMRYFDRIKGVVGNFSQGTPEPEMAQYFGELHVYMAEHGHFWGWHCYWYPRPNETQERWNYTRWYYWYEAMARFVTLHPDSVITEMGADGGLVGKIDQGYHTTTLTDAEYISDVLQVKDLVERKCPRIKYGFLFAAVTYDRFKSFRLTPIVLQAILADNKPEVPVAIKENLVIDGRCMTIAQFDDYIKGLMWPTKRTSIYLHHTWRPTVVDWQGKATIDAMRRTYMTYEWTDAAGVKHIGWPKAPHLFIAPDGIWLFFDITKDGWHAGDEHNVGSIGVEMVGNYDYVLPSGPVLDNTIGALAVLYKYLRLSPDNIQFHRDVSVKTCPGTKVTKTWIIPLIKAAMNPVVVPSVPPPTPSNYEWTYRWRMLNTPDHALSRYMNAQGYFMKSPEFWDDEDPGEIAYQWGYDAATLEFVLLAAASPSWAVKEVYRMK
jgi:hypothetical protein